jgi:nicotinamide-nucleotide amidase
MTMPPDRPLRVAELLSIGSELTVGETRDTNSSELARELTRGGVRVARIQALPDHLPTVRDAFLAALDEADLVLSTGGLGPTPDDLTREAIAAALGETPAVAPELEAWLRALWERRNLPFLDVNLKQAWLIPSAVAIPNPNGTAPGWWVDAPGGRVIVAMPGPPREMRPMWSDWVMPRLAARKVGAGIEVRTLRLTGIGESQLAQQLGETLLRAANPIVATYARVEAVDVRISAMAEDAGDGRLPRTASELADEAEAAVMAVVAPYLWSRGETTWAMALDEALAARGWTLAVWESGTRGALASLLADMEHLIFAEAQHAPSSDAVTAAAEVAAEPSRAAGAQSGTLAKRGALAEPGALPSRDAPGAAMAFVARAVRERAGADVSLAVRVTPQGEDSAVEIAIESPIGSHYAQRLAFLRGTMGRNRAAITASALLLERLREPSASA